ncbi:MAG: histidine utilization repressor [Deltaproteobacteria bacterium]|nr:histidine utilization repressor [Deltaproteobacteria bacterium]
MAGIPAHHPLSGQAASLHGLFPRYQQVKNYIIEGIGSGKWAAGARVPSEAEIVKALGVSRMTVNRALRELTTSGRLVRLPGVGTFVAAPAAPHSSLLEIKSIDDEIAERGMSHVSEVLLLAAETASVDLARGMEMEPGAKVFHSIILHRENGLAIQLEDRHVNPLLARDYLSQDFTKTTPSKYLFSLSSLSEAEHIITAIIPDKKIRKLLEMGLNEPCLVLHRRTWSEGLVATKAKFFHPASRYMLGGRFKPPQIPLSLKN